MGIRLDQLHPEIFAKIQEDILAKSTQFTNFVDSKIASIIMVSGLPEAAHIEFAAEINKKNLEQSGFVHLNRALNPYGLATQGETGIWISNLNTNISPFEASTIDGQKRSVAVAGYNINYTKGDIGSDASKLLKLPIAPNKPVYFAEDNDMSISFPAKKTTATEKNVTDVTLSVSTINELDAYGKIDILQADNGSGGIDYTFQDALGAVFYIGSDNRPYPIGSSSPLTEKYKLFSQTMSDGSFTINYVYDKNVERLYVSETNVCFYPSTISTSGFAKYPVYKDFGAVSKQVYFKDGMFVTHTISESFSIPSNLSEQQISPAGTVYSFDAGFYSDGVMQYVLEDSILKYVQLETSKYYLTEEQIANIVINLSGEETFEIASTKYVVSNETVKKVMVVGMPLRTTSGMVVNYNNGILEYFDANTNAKVPYDSGKIYFYDKITGIKYYKNIANAKYFISEHGLTYAMPEDASGIREILIKNSDTSESVETLAYFDYKYWYYIDDSIRKYIENDTYVLIQSVDVDGDYVYTNTNKTLVNTDLLYVKSDSGTIVSKIKNSDGTVTEQTVSISFLNLIPNFDKEERMEDALQTEFDILFNIAMGDVSVSLDKNKLYEYDDYCIYGNVNFATPLIFNQTTKIGDKIYLKRRSRKDIILSLEKNPGEESPQFPGKIVYSEELTGNHYAWIHGQTLNAGQTLEMNSVVKKGFTYFKYLGADRAYVEGGDNTILVQEGSVLWENVTAQEVEYERFFNTYTILNAAKGDTIRFSVIRTVWEKNSVGETVAVTQPKVTLERIVLQTDENGTCVFNITDQNFNLDDDLNLVSYILTLDRITPYSSIYNPSGTFHNNELTSLFLNITGIQTVAVNQDAALEYGKGYSLSKNKITFNNLVNDNMNSIITVSRFAAPQEDIKIEFDIVTNGATVEIPFENVKNKFDIVIPKKLDGNSYNWVLGDALPDGKVIKAGDIVFDKQNMRFYKYLGVTIPTNVDLGKILLRSILSDSEKEALIVNIKNFTVDQYNEYILSGAIEAAYEDGVVLNLTSTVQTDIDIVNIWKNIAVNNVIDQLAHEITIIDTAAKTIDGLAVPNLDIGVLNKIKTAIESDLPQSVLKVQRFKDNGMPELDESGKFVYDYVKKRIFYAEKNAEGNFITRDTLGNEAVLADTWEDVTVSEVGYYRYGKTFTILNVKEKDEIVIRLLQAGAEEFTTHKQKVYSSGSLTTTVDFSVDDGYGFEFPLEVKINKINFKLGQDYTQEGNKITIFAPTYGEDIIIRRNDEFTLNDIVILERKDLVFIEVWHEKVADTGWIFPNGNVQFSASSYDGIATQLFDGDKGYCQSYQLSNMIYDYFVTDANGVVSIRSDKDMDFIRETFIEDTTVGRGWTMETLSDAEIKAIFNNPDNNLYYDGSELIQIRYRTRIVAMDPFRNYFAGNTPYLSQGLRFQGKSSKTDEIIRIKVGETTNGSDIISERLNLIGDKLIVSSHQNSLLYKMGKSYDNSLFTVESKTDLSHNGIIYSIPVAIVHRRNQGVYHDIYNPNGTAFFINGIHVSEDTQDFSDDITGFSLIDEQGSTLQVASTGRDRKAKFKDMLSWLFDPNYKAGGSMVSKTTYRADKLLFDQIDRSDVIDLRIDANDQRRRIENLEAASEATNFELSTFKEITALNFTQHKAYVDTKADIFYKHLSDVESGLREEIVSRANALTHLLDETNQHISDLSSSVFTKEAIEEILIYSLKAINAQFAATAFKSATDKLENDEIEAMVRSFTENMEGPYTKVEFIKFLNIFMKVLLSETIPEEDALENFITFLSVKDLKAETKEYFTRSETLELFEEAVQLISKARVLPAVGSESVDKWAWSAKRYNGNLGAVILNLETDFLDVNKAAPVDSQIILTNSLTQTYTDLDGSTKNSGYFAGPKIWGDVHNYHAIYTTYIFVKTPFKVDYVKMNGDDAHAIYINKKLVAANKYPGRTTPYSYDFSVPGWYRIDVMYNEAGSDHYVQLGWNPMDYTNNILWMTSEDMQSKIDVARFRTDNMLSKLNILISTIDGDGSGFFYKLETKLIAIELLKRLRTDFYQTGITYTDANAVPFINSLIDWLDNGQFLRDLDYTVQEGSIDPFRLKYTTEELAGFYNYKEVENIVVKMLTLVNGLDSLNSEDITNFFKRLYIKIPNVDTTNGTYYTIDQVNAIITDTLNSITGLDKLTEYEIKNMFVEYLKTKNYPKVNVTTNAYTRSGLHTKATTDYSAFLGAAAQKK